MSIAHCGYIGSTDQPDGGFCLGSGGARSQVGDFEITANASLFWSQTNSFCGDLSAEKPC